MISTRDVARRALSQLLQRQPTSDAKIRFAWESSVGNSMARATSVQFDTSGTLHVKTDTEEWRREILRSVPLINQRLAEMLGSSVVKRITVK